MKLQNVPTLQGIFQPVSLLRSPHFFFWLPATDIEEHMILYPVLSKQDTKQGIQS